MASRQSVRKSWGLLARIHNVFVHWVYVGNLVVAHGAGYVIFGQDARLFDVADPTMTISSTAMPVDSTLTMTLNAPNLMSPMAASDAARNGKNTDVILCVS